MHVTKHFLLNIPWKQMSFISFRSVEPEIQIWIGLLKSSTELGTPDTRKRRDLTHPSRSRLSPLLWEAFLHLPSQSWPFPSLCYRTHSPGSCVTRFCTASHFYSGLQALWVSQAGRNTQWASLAMLSHWSSLLPLPKCIHAFLCLILREKVPFQNTFLSILQIGLLFLEQNLLFVSCILKEQFSFCSGLETPKRKTELKYN